MGPIGVGMGVGVSKQDVKGGQLGTVKGYYSLNSCGYQHGGLGRYRGCIEKGYNATHSSHGLGGQYDGLGNSGSKISKVFKVWNG